jgi:hypothetical protein
LKATLQKIIARPGRADDVKLNDVLHKLDEQSLSHLIRGPRSGTPWANLSQPGTAENVHVAQQAAGKNVHGAGRPMAPGSQRTPRSRDHTYVYDSTFLISVFIKRPLRRCVSIPAPGWE